MGDKSPRKQNRGKKLTTKEKQDKKKAKKSADGVVLIPGKAASGKAGAK
ncbi:MAG: hypothetical protein ACI8PZ_005285 [Myxococcota bacterium]|jgi:hypothetical protein